jgi:two-component system, OmpR family, response regulator
MHVLLIEDDPSLAKFYSRALMRAGHVVTVHRRGDEGLQAARTGSCDIIILDWFLPVMDGISLLRELRGQGIETPVLMMSGSGELGRREALAAGADAFLAKPCGLDELIAAAAALSRDVRGSRGLDQRTVLPCEAA